MTNEAIKEMGLHLVSEDLIARRVGADYVSLARAVIMNFYRWTSIHGIVDIREATSANLLAFRDWQAAQLSKTTSERLKHSSVNQRFGLLRHLYACLYRAGLIDRDPAQQLTDPLPTETASRRALTEEEIKAFLDAFDTTTRQGLKDRAMFELIYAAGLRVSEVATLKVADVDFQRRIMRVRGKGDKDRLVPISEVARDVLLLFLNDRAGDSAAWIFTGTHGPQPPNHIQPDTISTRFRTLMRRFGMDKPDLTAHSVRHATATHLLDHGVSVRQVQELLGHTNIETTARYTHVVTDNLKRLYRRFHPREQAIFEEVDAAYLKRLTRLAPGSDSG
jgi:site-specific recombinase XerD